MTLTIRYNPSNTKPCIRYMSCDIRCTLVGSTFMTSSATGDNPDGVFVNKYKKVIFYTFVSYCRELYSVCSINSYTSGQYFIPQKT